MSSTALVPAQPQANGVALFADNPAERRRMFLNLIQRDISEDQLQLLFGICDRYGFDPMLKHVVLIQKGMYVTRDGMRQYAHRTGELDGIEEVEASQGRDGKWRVTVAVYRRGCARRFVATAHQAEHENEKSAPWLKSPYRMTAKCAELAALRMAFPIALGGAEEVGYDGVSDRTNIGRATVVEGQFTEADPAGPTGQALADAVAALHEMDRDGIAFVQIRAAAEGYRERATAEQYAAVRAALKAIGDRRKAAAPQDPPRRVPPMAPGDYSPTVREDGRPILGDTPEARQAMLARIRAAMAAAGKTEREVNEYVGAVYNVVAFEALAAEQAKELLVELEMAAAGRSDSAFGEGGAPAEAGRDDAPASADGEGSPW